VSSGVGRIEVTEVDPFNRGQMEVFMLLFRWQVHFFYTAVGWVSYYTTAWVIRSWQHSVSNLYGHWLNL